MKKLSKGSSTDEECLALWVQYHYMVDVLKIFIKSKQLADHNVHLSCIVTRILDIFLVAGHHLYAKGALISKAACQDFVRIQRDL